MNSNEPHPKTLAALESAADLCWAEATGAYRQITNEERDQLLYALESDNLVTVMLLPGKLLMIICGFALAALVEARLRVERQDIEGNDDDYVCEFEPD